MKKLSLVLFILVTLLIPNISQSSISNLLNQSDDQKEIDLRGSLDETLTRSVLQTPIYATIGSTSLDVDFLSNLGEISVEVYSLLGNLVYENKANTQIQQKVSIMFLIGIVVSMKFAL